MRSSVTHRFVTESHRNCGPTGDKVVLHSLLTVHPFPREEDRSLSSF